MFDLILSIDSALGRQVALMAFVLGVWGLFFVWGWWLSRGK
jgi:hypothetical protein